LANIGAVVSVLPGAGAGARLFHHDGRGKRDGFAQRGESEGRPEIENAAANRRGFEPDGEAGMVLASSPKLDFSSHFH